MTPRQIRAAANSPWPVREVARSDGSLIGVRVRQLGRTRGGGEIVQVLSSGAVHILKVGGLELQGVL